MHPRGPDASAVVAAYLPEKRRVERQRLECARAATKPAWWTLPDISVPVPSGGPDGGMAGRTEDVQGAEQVVAAGYLNGFPHGTFQPLGSATRAQAAQVLGLVLQKRTK